MHCIPFAWGVLLALAPHIDPDSLRAMTRELRVDAATNSVNVMGTELPRLPEFPTLDVRPGVVRGYVKDWTGRPLAGASIGIRSSYFAGYSSGGRATTDATGYYEMRPPKGSASFYNAGYQVTWGAGVAPVSLHPVDGTLDSFVTMHGAVEHFVMLPYGITSRENAQSNPDLPSSFYGGALFFTWYSAEADDDNAPPFAVRSGSLLEITLTPDGPLLGGREGERIVIRKTVGPAGAFRVHNIPLGRYRLTVTADGKPLAMEESRKVNPLFGMTPAEAVETASILFVPGSTHASMVSPQHGEWDWISIRLQSR